MWTKRTPLLIGCQSNGKTALHVCCSCLCLTALSCCAWVLTLVAILWTVAPCWCDFRCTCCHIGFPVGGLTPPGRSMHRCGRTPSRFATVEGEAKQLSVPKLRWSPFGTLTAWGRPHGAKLTRRAKCTKIRNSTGTPCRPMHRKQNLCQKRVQAGGA